MVKEPFYFRPYIVGKELPPIEDYLKYFSGAEDEPYRMEASPTYLYGGARAAKIIKEVLGDVRSIICIRNPVDQLFSLYKHHLRFMKIDKDQSFLNFIKAKDDLPNQFYDVHIQAWYDVFGDDVKCIFFDDLIQRPAEVLEDVNKWLGLSPVTFREDNMLNANPGETYRYRSIHSLALRFFWRTKTYLPHQLFVKLRKLYYTFNGKKIEIHLSKEDREALQPRFSEHNNNLRQILTNRGYSDLPAWMID